MKKILISGSSRGIGGAITQNLLTQGHKVVGLARYRGEHDVVDGNYIPTKIDFSKIDSLEGKIKPLVKAHADSSVLILSCGYGHFTELEQFSVKQMQNLMNVNFTSQAILVKLFLPIIKKNQGKIIIIASEASLQGARKGTMYCASKFALRGFAQSLRPECAKAGVSVTLLNPGMVNSPFFEDLNFTPGTDDENSIQLQQLVDTINYLIKINNNCVVEEINMQPLKKVVRLK